MYSTIDFRIEGVVPMICHNSRLSNPLDPIVKEIKKITSKKSKTDEDHQEIAHLEFIGGLYLNKDGVPCVPGENLEALFKSAGKKNKFGKQFEAGLLISDEPPIIYQGPKDPEKMWQSQKLHITVPVGNRGNKVMRTRPMFNEWALEFQAHYLPDLLDDAQIRTTLILSGEIIGLNDWRPRFGRFVVK